MDFINTNDITPVLYPHWIASLIENIAIEPLTTATKIPAILWHLIYITEGDTYHRTGVLNDTIVMHNQIFSLIRNISQWPNKKSYVNSINIMPDIIFGKVFIPHGRQKKVIFARVIYLSWFSPGVMVYGSLNCRQTTLLKWTQADWIRRCVYYYI